MFPFGKFNFDLFGFIQVYTKSLIGQVMAMHKLKAPIEVSTHRNQNVQARFNFIH